MGGSPTRMEKKMERNNNINLEEILADYARLKEKEKNEYVEERNIRERQCRTSN